MVPSPVTVAVDPASPAVLSNSRRGCPKGLSEIKGRPLAMPSIRDSPTKSMQKKRTAVRAACSSDNLPRCLTSTGGLILTIRAGAVITPQPIVLGNLILGEKFLHPEVCFEMRESQLPMNFSQLLQRIGEFLPVDGRLSK